MMPFAEALELDRIALDLLRRDVDRLDVATLTLPTPCEGWTVQDLLDHMNTEHTAICGANADHDRDPRSAFSEIADRWMAFFEATMGQTILVPKMGAELPSEVVLSVHFADMVVHRWDLATSVGSSSPVPPSLIEKAEDVAAVVTAGGSPLVGPDGVYRAALPADPGATRLGNLVRKYGRDPSKAIEW